MKSDRKALGRGLGALINGMNEIEKTLSESVSPSSSAVLEIKKIHLDKIRNNPSQPRQNFNMEKLVELSESIKSNGVIQPIIVTPADENGKFQVVVGERRFRASRLAGKETIPAIVKLVDDKEMIEQALLENIQREDLNPIEEATSYKLLIDKFNYTQEQLAKRLGKSRSTLTNALRILNLSDDVKHSLIEGKITSGHARSLLSLDPGSEVTKVMKDIIHHDLSVRDTEEIVRNKSKSASDSFQKQKNKQKITSEIEFQSLTEKLKKSFNSKVEINGTSKKGKIEIHFNSVEHFNQIYSQLIKIVPEE